MSDRVRWDTHDKPHVELKNLTCRGGETEAKTKLSEQIIIIFFHQIHFCSLIFMSVNGCLLLFVSLNIVCISQRKNQQQAFFKSTSSSHGKLYHVTHSMFSTKDVLKGLHCSKLTSLALRPSNRDDGRG